HFDMNQQPGLAAVPGPDLEELIREPLADFASADDLLQFLVEAFVAATPIDAGVDFREAQGQERFQKMFQGFLPRAIQFFGLALRCCHGRTVAARRATLKRPVCGYRRSIEEQAFSIYWFSFLPPAGLSLKSPKSFVLPGSNIRSPLV